MSRFREDYLTTSGLAQPTRAVEEPDRRQMSVPADAAVQVLELAAEGLGRKRIGMLTGIASGTVKRIIDGAASVQVSDELTARQRAALLNGMSVPSFHVERRRG